MKNRKGFTMMEAVIGMVLMGLIVLFFTSVYTHSFRTLERGMGGSSLVFIGQEKMEEAIAKRAGDVAIVRDLPAGTPLPDGVSAPDVTLDMWGNSIRGYSVGEMVQNATTGKSVNLASFIYFDNRKPPIPSVAIKDQDIKFVVPKFIYLGDIKGKESYSYRFEIINADSLRRIVERTYKSKKHIEFDDGKKYITRPYTDLGADESTPIPKYSPIFSRDFDLISSSTGRLIVGAGVAGGVLNAINDVSYGPLFDNTHKDDMKDVQLLRVVQTQSINNYTGGEQIVPQTMTWIIGVPVVDKLIGHWDANLMFESITGDTITSHKNNVDLSDTGIKWQNVNELLNKTGHVAMKILSSPTVKPKLSVKDAAGEYRRFSNGVQIPVGSRLKLDTVNGFGDLSTSNGKKNYTLFIRAKQLDPNSTSALLSINTNDAGSIISSAPSQEAFGMFINTNSSSLFARYDAGVKEEALGNQRNFSGMLENPMKAPKYTDAKDDRAGYRVYGLRFKNAGQEDKYAVSVFVDGDETTKKLSDFGMANVWLDLDIFGMDIGSNLEVSDILVYEKEFSNDEIKAMSEYLYKKYEP